MVFLYTGAIVCAVMWIWLQVIIYRKRKQLDELRIEISDYQEYQLQRTKDILELLYSVEDIMVKCNNAPAVSRLTKAAFALYSREIDALRIGVEEGVCQTGEERSRVRSCIIGGANQ